MPEKPKEKKKVKGEIFDVGKPPLFPTEISLTLTSADNVTIVTFLYSPKEREGQEYVLARLALTPKQKAFLSENLAPEKKKTKKKSKKS